MRAHFWQTLANYTQSAGGMILGVVLAHLLQPKIFGDFVLVGASLSLLMIPASFSSAQILVSDGGKTPELFQRVLGMAVWVCLLKLLALIGFVGFSWALGKTEQASIGILIGLPMVLAEWFGVVKSDLEGRGFFCPNFLVQAANLATQATVTITMALQGWGIYALALGPLAGFISDAILYTTLTDRNITRPDVSLNAFKAQFRFGVWLWLGSVASSGYSRVDKIFLGHFGGPTQLAFYNRAMNYGPISHILLNSLMTNATIRGLIAKDTIPEKKALFQKTAIFVLSGAVANGLFWHLFSDPLIPWIFGEPWRESASAFKILGWLGVPYFLLYGSSAVLYANNKFQAIACVHLAAVVFLFCGAFFLACTRGINVNFAALLFIVVMLFSGCAMTILALSTFKEIHAEDRRKV